MENVYAALLLHKAGKEISEENLKSVIKAAGAEADEGQIKSLVTSLKGVDIDKELESATLSVGAPSGGASGKTESEAPKEEEKKEEKEEEKAPAAEGLSALFG